MVPVENRLRCNSHHVTNISEIVKTCLCIRIYIYIYSHTSHVVKKCQIAGCFIGPPDLDKGENPLFWQSMRICEDKVPLHLKEFKK